MMPVIIGKHAKHLYGDLKKYFYDFYAGKIRRCCDEDCPEGCDGKHNYELPKTFPPLFKEN